ncbi:hypothetical protein [Mesorhizobium sp.]|uniref:hypothetical protein n=1 Tax=Mesorhizobium sp. TaxID=1871066 RepID=UPI000FE45A6C|nr:hypothetical protein [Mesorhizobium sp.]RWE86947.1 MAG: hypothetical protein EOS49_11835 [Mesorhizobium sp.]
MYRLSGWASTPSQDEERCRFALKSIPITNPYPPLLLSDKGAEVGRILLLEWRAAGLWAEVLVNDEHAQIKGFSVGCQLDTFETIGLGQPAYSLVTGARLTELSITDRPCNAEAIVLHRAPYNPIDLTPLIKANSAYLDTIISKFDVMRRAIEELL